ncbi:MAG TPA: phage holin family protein [Burkholderiaceae bacterium]|nr:phage holin family protein [Burkholderiaceae bacterium]
MPNKLVRFLLHWLVTSLSLWVASRVFSGIHFADASSLIISALVLGFANAIVRPLLIILTLPLTLLTLGLFLLVINAAVLMLVSALVSGFTISSFGTAFLASIFIAITSYLIGAVLGAGARPQ